MRFKVNGGLKRCENEVWKQVDDQNTKAGTISKPHPPI